jgi:DNA mismatch endonuclease, patch repair protein
MARCSAATTTPTLPCDAGNGALRLPILRRLIMPAASSPAASSRMQRQRRRDTAPELALRSELHRRGLRYRVNAPIFNPRRRHDIVFNRVKVVVEVRGCFWHGCSEHGTSPKANAAWWRRKIDENRRRDQDTDRRLADEGWRLVVVWEHEPYLEAADRVEAAVTSASADRLR